MIGNSQCQNVCSTGLKHLQSHVFMLLNRYEEVVMGSLNRYEEVVMGSCFMALPAQSLEAYVGLYHQWSYPPPKPQGLLADTESFEP